VVAEAGYLSRCSGEEKEWEEENQGCEIT
jgi:hypothetical protein